ncbi:hypothetical protein VNO78_00023 [Psophocarpus tetragonolobus]|uniref:GPI inositol-deacylase n=1 Tax=Psophocarpus tetragonolobus TaxID=3891 RepID=A0AAN9XTU6_PSOTE
MEAAGISGQRSKPSSQPVLCSSNYRPAVILPGLGNNSGDYERLKETLKEKYGVEAVVAKVSRVDWLRNAAGLMDPNYWRGSLEPRPVLDWYMERVQHAVEQAKDKDKDKDKEVSLIGHSAGGWLARLYMQEYGVSHVSLLLTLGTPHLPPPPAPGVIDQTRGLLHYVQQNCSNPVYTPQLKYVCIASRYIKGARLFGNSNPEATPTFRARIVGQGYKQVCGQADVWGDGVVPQVSAHLEGALNICLHGVYHSPVGADDATRPWYGSPHVLDQWVQHLLD